MKKFAILSTVLAVGASGCGKKEAPHTAEPVAASKAESTPATPPKADKAAPAEPAKAEPVKAEPQPEPVKAEPQPEPAKAEPQAAAMTPVTIDPEIQKRVDAIVAKCTIDEATASVSGCPSGEDFAIIDYAANQRIKTLFESLGEIALTTKDPKVKAAIIGTWNSFRDSELQILNSTAAAAERVLALYPDAPVNSFSFPAAAAVPLAAGKRAEFTAVLQKMPASALRNASFQAYLQWGGVAALPDVQAFYSAAADDNERYAATWSVGVALYDGEAEVEKVIMCDWVKAIAADAAAPSGGVRGAISSLGRCKGPYIDVALAAIESRIATEKFNDSTANSLNSMCWTEGVIGGVVNGTPEQCAKVMTLLETAVNDKETQPGAVRQALWVIGNVGKYGEGLMPRAKKLLGKFKSNANKELAEQAVRSLDGLK